MSDGRSKKEIPVILVRRLKVFQHAFRIDEEHEFGKGSKDDILTAIMLSRYQYFKGAVAVAYPTVKR